MTGRLVVWELGASSKHIGGDKNGLTNHIRRAILEMNGRNHLQVLPIPRESFLRRLEFEAKQPNSTIRKCARVQLIKNGKKIAAFVPNDSCLNYIEENDEVLIARFGRKGHVVGDIPGVRFRVMQKTALHVDVSSYIVT
ncbi:small ribosomal subunit protein uS12y-like [Magnolia sinica]|uniref:small ribosomal subunit protein uS12y-like n=1 Tax=Magnolia sinica TaxID=86752 RepID=UPI00265B5E6F|nr:small ribosomal subunit protein uS12y-like [Magnolia sinica]